MTNEDIINVANACLLYFTTTDMAEDEEQEFLDYYREVQDLPEITTQEEVEHPDAGTSITNETKPDGVRGEVPTRRM